MDAPIPDRLKRRLESINKQLANDVALARRRSMRTRLTFLVVVYILLAIVSAMFKLSVPAPIIFAMNLLVGFWAFDVLCVVLIVALPLIAARGIPISTRISAIASRIGMSYLKPLTGFDSLNATVDLAHRLYMSERIRTAAQDLDDEARAHIDELVGQGDIQNARFALMNAAREQVRRQQHENGLMQRAELVHCSEAAKLIAAGQYNTALNLIARVERVISEGVAHGLGDDVLRHTQAGDYDGAEQLIIASHQWRREKDSHDALLARIRKVDPKLQKPLLDAVSRLSEFEQGKRDYRIALYQLEKNINTAEAER